MLTVGQVAVSFMLLIGAGLLLSSFYKLQQVESGFDRESVLTAEIFPNWSKYRSADSRRQLFTGVLDRLQGRPGIESVAVANMVPMASDVGFPSRFAIEDAIWRIRRAGRRSSNAS